MAVNVPILVGILVFYALIFIAGLVAARMSRKRKSATESETLIAGARDIGFAVGLCTMAATWYDGVAINGTAESVYLPHNGLLWAIVPVAATGLSIILNGIFFVKIMRETGYLSSLDPFEAKFGKYSTIIFFLLEAAAGILYIGAVLNALGGTLEVVAGISRIPSVIVSAVVSTLYTVIGGLYSVAYTDVIQLCMMLGGLILAIPFVLTNEAVASISETAYASAGTPYATNGNAYSLNGTAYSSNGTVYVSAGTVGWMGTLYPEIRGSYADFWIAVMCGAIPLQVIYQRVFAVKTTRHAQIVCVGAGLIKAILVIPPVLIGAGAASTNWSMTAYMDGNNTNTPFENNDQRLILPLVLHYLTPTAVAFFGLGAVSAGVMSSMDSALLAVGTIFGRNIYKKLLHPNASEREVVILIRFAILVEAIAASALALSADTIIGLYQLCVDFTYIATFPQFFSILFLNPNIYGSIPALIISIVLRIGGGEYALGWVGPFSYIGGSNFPFRTVAMLSAFITLNVFSYVAKFLFENGYVDERYDFLKSNLARGGRTIYLNEKNVPRKERDTELPEIKRNEYVEEQNDE